MQSFVGLVIALCLILATVLLDSWQDLAVTVQRLTAIGLGS